MYNLKFLLAISTLALCLSKIKELEFLENLFKNTHQDSATIYANAYPGKSPRDIQIVLGQELDNNALASAIHTEAWRSEGWDYLKVISRASNHNNTDQAYAAGYLEGYLTRERIYNHYLNMKQYLFEKYNNTMPDHVRKFLADNYQWIKSQGQANKGDPFWDRALLLQVQLEGLIDGYNNNVPGGEMLSYEDFQVMNAFGDIFDIVYYKPSERPNFQTMSKDELDDYVDRHTHCSSIIKLTSDFSDLFMSHNTWFSYLTMTRIFKEYKLEYGSIATSITLSGYPGTLSSVDDFYVTSNKLYVAETTNAVFNNTLYDVLTPKSVLTWMRAMIANNLASNSEDWIKLFARYNSGTYNNQFMVVDLKKVDLRRRTMDNGTFWIIEQLPGYVQSKDMTQWLLTNKYWASYNAAYFDEVIKRSGYAEMIKEHPEMVNIIDHEKCARANIFRRDQGNVKTINDMKVLMRYNEYQTDPLSKGDAGYAIASRKDLNESNPKCSGAMDVKLISYRSLLEDNVIHIISGPTYQDQPVFETHDTLCNADGRYTFYNMVDRYDFDWVEYRPQLLN
jgi:hypothetical protein